MPTTTTETRATDATVPEKRDFRQEVTDRIVKMLSQSPPEKTPWHLRESNPEPYAYEASALTS